MFICELRRSSYSKNEKYSTISDNLDLIKIIDKIKPKKIILFRAGLVISREVISKGIPLLNIHCASIPEYGGLGSIDRALKNKSFSQNATLHQVTTTIDKGKVYDTEPYLLNPKK